MEINGQVYKEEASELLVELEEALLELEKTPDDRQLVDRAFRAMHTIKGSGAMFGFDDISSFAHEVETAFDFVRSGKMTVDRTLIDLTLKARDQIKAMLDGKQVDCARTHELVAAFRNKSQSEVTYRIRFSPDANILKKGTNPILLLDELRTLGDCKIAADTDRIALLPDFDPEACCTDWDIILTTSQGINAIRDVFVFVEDNCDLKIDVIDDGKDVDDGNGCKRLGEILVERGDVCLGALGQTLGAQATASVYGVSKPIGKMLVESGAVSASKVEAALLEQQHLREKKESRKDAAISSTIRVESDKLDKLVNLVGELVVVQARLTQSAATRRDSDLFAVAEEVERLTADLRDNTMSIRMLPIGTTFSRFKRVVRDLSSELGKEVEMTTDGAETELDKTVIERLADPLIHIIRNSVDHGIESPDVRQQRGKPRIGTVHLAAAHAGAHVLIRIKDDGAGLDKEVIRAKAVEQGLISRDDELSDKEIFSLILAAGLSTANKVTSVSGRGVGMDVVKRGIEALRGSIDIESVKGKGTTIILKLPLTLAIIDGLLVVIDNKFFVLPLAEVEECIELTRKDVASAHGRHIARVRGQIVPYISMREHFSLGGRSPVIEQVVLTGVGGRRVGIVVDRVLGQHQTVIKPLGEFYKEVEEISGATMLGDGTVALIVNVSKLIDNAQTEELAALGSLSAMDLMMKGDGNETMV